MSSLPIGQMIRDAEIVERTLGEDMRVSPIADVCIHVKALAVEVAGQMHTIEAQQVVVENLERKVAALKKALEPFAYQARIIDENDKADGNGPEEQFALFRFRNSYTAISLGDCRRAREAIQ